MTKHLAAREGEGEGGFPPFEPVDDLSTPRIQPDPDPHHRPM